MYLQNKYTKCYYSIINRAKSRELPKEIYTEKHHIIPKSLGGSNDQCNLVRLTAKEHRLAHILLPRMTTDTIHTRSMWYALWMMLRTKNAAQQRKISKGSAFEIAKIKVAEAMSLLHKGIPRSYETKRKLSDARKGMKIPKIAGDNHYSKRTNFVSKISGKNHYKYGKKQSVESNLKRSKKLKGRASAKKGINCSEETKQRMSDSKKNKILINGITYNGFKEVFEILKLTRWQVRKLYNI